MKKIYLLMMASLMSIGFVACSEDKIEGASIYDTTPPQRDAFAEWVLQNFTYPYNVDFQYKLKDIETDFDFTLVPADSAKSAKLAQLVKYLWFDAYNEVVGQNFVKQNTPRLITLIGCPGYQNNGTMVLGTAEGGYKVVLYMVNELTDETLQNYQVLTDYYFTTMHNEFMHILNQKIPYDPEFDRISEADYVSGNWYRQSTETVALPKGFIRNYAMVEGREDYAETYSQYITNSDELWASKLATAGEEGSAIILRKLDMIRTYMKDSWGLDIDELHRAVQHRAQEMNSLDLETLN